MKRTIMNVVTMIFAVAMTAAMGIVFSMTVVEFGYTSGLAKVMLITVFMVAGFATWAIETSVNDIWKCVRQRRLKRQLDRIISLEIGV